MIDRAKRRTLRWSMLTLAPLATTDVGAADAGTTASAASPLSPVSESDPLAQAIGFKQDAANVDGRYFPARKLASARNEVCGDCLLFRPADAHWGHCVVMIPQGVVNVMGWCGRWTPIRAR
jgi:hypothetical protein